MKKVKINNREFNVSKIDYNYLEKLANEGMSAEQLANVFLKEYFEGKKISYPINPFQMLTDLNITFFQRKGKR